MPRPFLNSHTLVDKCGPFNRNRVPWIILIVCWATSGILLLITRWYLARENAKRDQEKHDSTYDDVYVSIDQDGVATEKKVDKVCGFLFFTVIVIAAEMIFLVLLVLDLRT